MLFSINRIVGGGPIDTWVESRLPERGWWVSISKQDGVAHLRVAAHVLERIDARGELRGRARVGQVRRGQECFEAPAMEQAPLLINFTW